MEVRLPAEKEARLREFASRAGKPAEAVVEDAVDRLLEHSSRPLKPDAIPPAGANCSSTTKLSRASSSCFAPDARPVDGAADAAAGRAMPIKDSLIAATAIVHGLAVVTRSREDFAKAGVRVIDPFLP
jgi:predicted nucleic acid-binding protein